jgi:hypothetical protein
MTFEIGAQVEILLEDVHKSLHYMFPGSTSPNTLTIVDRTIVRQITNVNDPATYSGDVYHYVIGKIIQVSGDYVTISIVNKCVFCDSSCNDKYYLTYDNDIQEYTMIVPVVCIIDLDRDFSSINGRVLNITDI